MFWVGLASLASKGAFISQAFFLLGIVAASLAIIVFVQRTKIVFFRELEKVTPEKTTLMALFFGANITILFTQSIFLGVIPFVFAIYVQLISYLSKKFKKIEEGN